MNGKKYLCGFADKRLKKSTKRFAKQAKEMNIYDGIYLYNEDDLDPDFRFHFKDKFSLKGYGYWVWKPQIILQTLAKMEDGDILQYTDIGCHLNKNGKKRLEDYFNIANESETGILGFNNQHYMEYEWTKGDVFDYFNIRNNKEVFYGQVVGGIIFIKKCNKSIEIIKSFLKVFYEDFSLVDDSPSKSKNFKEFKEHRHDQSIWSILAKTNKIHCLSHKEQYSLNWEDLKEYPILAKRDKVYKTTFFQVIKRKLSSLRIKIKAIKLSHK